MRQSSTSIREFAWRLRRGFAVPWRFLGLLVFIFALRALCRYQRKFCNSRLSRSAASIHRLSSGIHSPMRPGCTVTGVPARDAADSSLASEEQTDSSRLHVDPAVQSRMLMPVVESPSKRTIIEAALAKSRGRVSGPLGAAAKLKIAPSTLAHRIEALNINKSQL
jgi:hypothetical protein